MIISYNIYSFGKELVISWDKYSIKSSIYAILQSLGDIRFEERESLREVWMDQ